MNMRAFLMACVLACVAFLPNAARASLLVLSYHDIRDDVAPKGDPDKFAVSTRNFAMQLDWLRAHGYTAVSAQQVIDARAGRGTLPAKSVLLTFDDGLRSTYTHAFPLLRAYGMPGVIAVTTSWIESDVKVPYGPRDFTRDDFLTWAQLREMRESGVFEIASHSHALHAGILGNPQGNSMPAAITRLWQPGSGYETEAAYRARIDADIKASADAIAAKTGAAPRIIVWPYAAYNEITNAIAARHGMPTSFDLEGRSRERDLLLQGRETPENEDLRSLSRLLLFNNPDIRDLVYELRHDTSRNGVRAVQIDLDYVYDADPAQTERNLDVLVERVRRIGPSHVFLQAFADPDGDGAADAMYFPNRHMPMRADLFNRVAWQLASRAQVRVFAWMPVIGFELTDAALRSELQIKAPDPKDIPRLDPRDPRTLALVGDLYEDLAISSPFTGLLFHDDAYLREDELTDFPQDQRTKALVDFTHALRNRAEQWRPKLVTVRNLFAEPVLNPASEAWFAQRLDVFNRAYDYTALMAMPYMEQAADPQDWLTKLAKRVGESEQGLRHTIFELQTVDWRSTTPIPGDTLRAQSRMLQALGARHLAYYPDGFLKDRPPLSDAREAMSARAFPYIER